MNELHDFFANVLILLVYFTILLYSSWQKFLFTARELFALRVSIVTRYSEGVEGPGFSECVPRDRPLDVVVAIDSLIGSASVVHLV